MLRAVAASLLTIAGASAGACAGESAGRPPQSLPGALPFDEGLALELAAALAARGSGYAPRTRHLLSDGSPRFTNRLILETSPYLLQHAHNPVNWYPWGEEAFEAARRLGRPVLLSVGYSTCHWCHVMEEESFEDEEIAAVLNARYVAIKVDREERPDVDAVYMTAVQVLGGSAGWPMTVWLTPDRTPFHGGSYFPARDGDRGEGSVGFLTLLAGLAELYQSDPSGVAGTAERVTARVREFLGPPLAGESIPPRLIETAVERFSAIFDSTHGGVAGAPKFPSSLPVRLLLRHHRRTGERRSLEMATLTLERMARGGIRDQIGGGFHRYATDRAWLVPHFEKMLYDNALLTQAYLEGAQATGEASFAEIARQTLDYVLREMTDPAGGFYSATDADSPGAGGERKEGAFFTWTPAEVREVLPPDDAQLVERYFGITERGNFEGRSVLHVERPAASLASALGLDAATLAARLSRLGAQLYEVRRRRPTPARDEKILVAWNGLMIQAMARAGFQLDEPAYLDQARRAAEFVLREMAPGGRLLRSYKDGRAAHAAYLDDYACFIAGLLDLFEATAEPRWLEAALVLQTVLDARYADAERGGYFMTSDDHERLLAREKPVYDGAEPSGNAVALSNLLRLGALTADDRYRQRADRLVAAFAGVLAERPTASGEMLIGLDFRASAPKEIAIVTASGRAEAEPFLDVLREVFVPAKVVAVLSEGERPAFERLLPWIHGKGAQDGRVTAYVCESGACRLPTSDADTFRELLVPVARAGSR